MTNSEYQNKIIEDLKERLPPGSHIRAEATHRSRSGLTHDVALYAQEQYGNRETEVNITHAVARALDMPVKNEGIRVGGAGFDKGGYLKMELSKTLYDDPYMLDGPLSGAQMEKLVQQEKAFLERTVARFQEPSEIPAEGQQQTQTRKLKHKM